LTTERAKPRPGGEAQPGTAHGFARSLVERITFIKDTPRLRGFRSNDAVDDAKRVRRIACATLANTMPEHSRIPRAPGRARRPSALGQYP